MGRNPAECSSLSPWLGKIGPLPKVRKEAGNPRHVASVLVAIFAKRVLLLMVGEADVHDEQDRKHRERQQRRPLQQEAEHHEHMLVVGLDNLRALKPALVRLYAGLSAEQKTVADRLLAHETGMMSGMQMGGRPRADMSGGMKKQ